MSHEILYDRSFIRTPKGIIPLILSGSNNSYDFKYGSNNRVYEVRERHWWAYVPNTRGPIRATEEELLKAWEEAFRDTAGTYELFKNRGSWLTVAQHRKWFSNGCKAARTIEEYRATNAVSLYGYLSVNPRDTNLKSEQEMNEYLRTTSELENWLDRVVARQKQVQEEKGDQYVTWISLAFTSTEPMKVGRVIKGEVVAVHKKSYVRDFEKGKSISFTGDPEQALVFQSEAHAREAFGVNWKDIHFVKASTVKAKKDYVIRISGGFLTSSYIKGRTKGRCYTTTFLDGAMRFRTEGEARQYAKKVLERSYRGLDRLSVYNTAEDIEVPVSIDPMAESA